MGTLVGVPVGVLVGVPVGVLVGVPVGVLVGVPVGVLVGVPVGVLVGSRAPTCQDYMPPPVTISPFWPCYWPSSFFFSHQVHALLKSLCKKTTKNIKYQDIPLALNTTRRGGYLNQATQQAYSYG
jgi:hypothetical protein